jgi:hypothetical protein
MRIEENVVVDAGREGFVVRTLDWLRAGYPAGVPREDYVVLLGLLRRKLTEVEVRQIATELAGGLRGQEDAITREDIETTIGDAVLQEASDQDVARVSARLAAGGWPLADPPLA